jgi:hypothetical protein
MTLRRAFLLLLPLACCLSTGCGSSKYAPVSGRILVNGKPLAKASVTFAPIGGKGNTEPGPSSAAITDEDGRYTLKLIGPEGNGAVIGKHKVSVALLDERSTADDSPVKIKQLPPKYHGQTILEFDVPAGGTEAADFDLKVP